MSIEKVSSGKCYTFSSQSRTIKEFVFFKFDRLPKGVVKSASYFMDKYGLNYKAMVKDEKNHDQETWRQFRAKIRKFMSIPEQFNVYLKQRDKDPENLGWSECDSGDE